MLAVAGLSGVIRVIDVSAELIFKNLKGHGNSVNDVRAHPCAPHLLLSASRDESCRLW
jgi:polycomb protein EED